MKLVKSLVLCIRALKWHHDVLRHNKQTKEKSFKTSPEEFIKYLAKSQRLETKGMRLQSKIDNLK